MADVFVSYSRGDRDRAATIAEKLSVLDVTVWYDRNIRPAGLWRRDIERELGRAKLVLTLWSATSVESRWVRYEATVADETGRLVSVRLTPCLIPPPFSEHQAVDLSGWTGDVPSDGWLDLVETIGEKLQRSELNEFAIFRRVQQRHPEVQASRRLHHYTFRDMMEVCDRLRDDVRSFDPDVMFCFDSRGGIWAEMFFDYLTYRVPVVVGYRMKRDGPKKSQIGLQGYARLQTTRWDLYVPAIVRTLPRGTRILLIDDYASTGDTRQVFREYVTATLGHDPENIGSVVLISSAVAARTERVNDRHGIIESADTVDLFYMFRR